MILLDTNAILWILTGHRRGNFLLDEDFQLSISPVSLLEIKFLIEVGRVQEVSGQSFTTIAMDPRWSLDNPSSEQLFSAAFGLDWTRDPFDRLLVAHALCRQWRLATGDRYLLSKLAPENVIPL